MNFLLATPDEILQELAQRLRQQRLRQQFSQQELALRAGIGLASLQRAEQGAAVGLDLWLKLVFALGLTQELEFLFQPRAASIADLQRKHMPSRQRAPRRKRKPGEST